MMLKFAPALILNLIFFSSYAQENWLSGIGNNIYNDSIKTVRIRKAGVEGSLPLIKLNSGDRIMLEFDWLDEPYQDLQYTFIHCDESWNPSDIFVMDYLDGLENNYVSKFRNSFNTYQFYTHYIIDFPNENVKFKIAGNYIIKVFRMGEPDKPILTQRFFVLNNKLNVGGVVRQPTFAKYRQYGHEIDFDVSISNVDIPDPYNNIKVVVMQNNRWDNVIRNLKPQFIQDQKLIYDYEDENIFMAGNEYRIADLRSVITPRFGVTRLYLDSMYNALLDIDEDRSYLTYTQYIDINGRYVIGTESMNKPSTESDYIKAKFRVSSAYELIPGDNIYLFGELTNWKVSEKYKLSKNKSSGLYELELKIKQGYYNYEYIVTNDLKGPFSSGEFEGNHVETENDYTIFVYEYHQLFDTYTLVGLSRLNSQILNSR